MSPRRLDEGLRDLLEAGRAAGAFPAAAAWVGVDGSPVASAVVGDVSHDTWWDLASLTKPLVTVAVAMRAVRDGRLSLDEPVRACDGGARTTVRHLLGHRSGLPAWEDFAAQLDATAGRGAWRPGSASTRAAIAGHIDAQLRRAPDAPATVYSDLGFITLGWHLEARLGAPLTALVPAVFRPARPADARRYAPTGRCPYRGRALRGEVNDLNAWVLGGAAGHAGAFATIDMVGQWAMDLERAAATAATTSASPPRAGDVVREFWDRGERRPPGTWVLGWDTPSPGYTSAGALASADAVGHLGFTGTSVWIEPSRRLVMVLLSNRTALGPDHDPAIKRFRPHFHDTIRQLARLA